MRLIRSLAWGPGLSNPKVCSQLGHRFAACLWAEQNHGASVCVPECQMGRNPGAAGSRETLRENTGPDLESSPKWVSRRLCKELSRLCPSSPGRAQRVRGLPRVTQPVSSAGPRRRHHLGVQAQKLGSHLYQLPSPLSEPPPEPQCSHLQNGRVIPPWKEGAL